ncbi:acyltransferase [Streptomyces sp. NPDC127092]|uniref:acyltransferase n=1 Tax=Streptomyces sp. NPDC127092 TaxID=3347135 RepID=UPI00365B1168
MTQSGERQGDLAAGLGQSQAQVSRKQAGKAHWSLEDVDLLAAHYRLHQLDLLAGPTHAVGVLHGAVPSLQAGAQALAVSPPSPTSLPAPAAHRELEPEAEAESAKLVAREVRQGPSSLTGPVWRPCVLCGQPAVDDVDGFPQHLTSAECAAAVSLAGAAAAAGTPAPPPALQSPSPAVQPPPALQSPSPAVQPPPALQSAASAVHESASLAVQPQPQSPPAAVQPQTTALAPAQPEPQSPQPPQSPSPVVQTQTTALSSGELPTSQSSPVPVPEAAVPPSVPAASGRSAPGYASGTLVGHITDRVYEVLAACAGDVEAAQAALVKAAIPDVMALLKASRVGGRYEHSEFPPTADILRKKSQKGADEIWEGRPKWRNPQLFSAAKKGERIEVTALDMNAAYLSALKCWLPIGQLREDTSGVHDPKKAGVHLITPPAWEYADLPNPLGHRMEPGELWVSEPTLRLLLDCTRQGLADAPVIHRSLVSGASEALLEKLRRALAETRKTALAEGDDLTVAYVKAMYSKFVSTIGESSSNREIRRPDWMHIIRAKAFANLWMKAHKAHKAGLQVVEISGTDELHVTGDWRAVFPEGRDLNQVKEKDTYILGGRR